MTPLRKFLAAAAAVALAMAGAAVLAGPASAQPTTMPVLPKQYFAGQVNGNSGSSVLSVEGCNPASVTPQSNSGYPLPGQTVDVHRFLVPPPASPIQLVGYTGRAHKISVDLVVNLVEPPLSYLVHLADLTAYDVTAPIPTTLKIPCTATVSAVFTPVAGGAKAVPSNVDLSVESPQITIGPTATTAAPVVTLHGTGFVPSGRYTVAECSQKSWIVPQDPCLDNTISVATDSGGTFTAPFATQPCTVILPSTCYIGVPMPSGVDVIDLVGAVKIVVP